MSSPINKMTLFTKTSAHVLRTTCIFTFLPSFIILLIHGIISGSALPAVGLIPLFFSTLFSVFALLSNKETLRLLSTLNNVFFDSLIATGLLIVLILSWVSDMGKNTWSANPGFIILGTYGTAFMLYNFVIHIFFIGAYLKSVHLTTHSCVHCQHCQHGVSLNATDMSGEEYGHLIDDEERPRQSDETLLVSGKDAA